MQDTEQKRILSIKELNNVLQKLQNKEDLPILGAFAEVDIVFVAGLFLWYKQHEKGWKRIPRFFYLTTKDNIWDHSYYFKLIDELYDIKHSQIFDNFPIYNIKGSFSRYFAPPIYITEESIDSFFGQKKNENFNKAKDNYIANFNISDFIDKRSKNYLDSENQFRQYEKEIIDRLNNYPPIFTFIFIIACKNLAKKNNETFDRRKDYIEKLFLFTQDYVRGLYELAKNIVEHSSSNGQKGEGMITIRAYSQSKIDTARVLETHVFDYGEIGIVPKLIEYTKQKATGSTNENPRIKECYVTDSVFFEANKNYKLDNFITPDEDKELRQQTFRHTSHYGIRKLEMLINTTLRSEMFVASQGLLGRDYYGENSENVTLKKGTHFYFKIPFIQDNFKNFAAKKFPQENQTAVLGETASLEFLSKINIPIKLSQLSQIPQTTKDSLLDIEIDNEKITKANVTNVYKLLDGLLNLNDNNRIAIDLQGKISDVSVLLRFLSYLSFEYKQSFIVYNINDQIYSDLQKDNEAFYLSRPSEAYWHNERAILLFINNNKNFYFADILFGKDKDEFLFVNTIVSKTFPNTTTILQIDEKEEQGENAIYMEKINSNQNLQQFFYPYSNNLLPFDALLKNKNDNNPLFVSNLKTILQNPLFGRNDSYKGLDEYIDNFDGFRILKTHFKIGTKIHSEDFYYAKRLFQNSFYTTRLAMLLAIKIKEGIKGTDKNITLVGYEMYSELLLSLIEKFLKHLGFENNKEQDKVNHFIMQTEDDNHKFLPNDAFKRYIENYNNRVTIIIVPIAATGSTANKIENDIRADIYSYEKNNKRGTNRSEEDARILSNEYSFFNPRYNILLAQSEDDDFRTIKKSDNNQTAIITLPAKWFKLKDCPLCYGVNENNESAVTKTLFETDKSSLTPALIFGKPIGKMKSKVGNEIESNIQFDDLKFIGSLKYKKIFRNNFYRIYYVDSYKFIENNISNITKWLSNVVKTHLNLKSTDKVTIVSPCHETNSRFLNMVNEIVFSSSATIIHHQNNIDFAENFKLLNKHYLSKGTKLFYVDDSLITGKHFYEISDLVKDAIPNLRKGEDKGAAPFIASIFLKDKSEPFTHNKIVELSNIFFAFANFNQPAAPNLLEQRPLEHERQRYEILSQTALHDVTIDFFQNKANGLNPQKLDNIKNEGQDDNKERRRLKTFEATHKIYDYFAKNTQTIDYDIDKIVSFKNHIDNAKPDTNLFPQYTEEEEKRRAEERQDNPKALLKVLSQYPFILYQPLKEKTFDWLKKWISEINEPNEACFERTDYDEFQTIKFLLRRAALLGNYQVLEPKFLQIIFFWFIKIDKYFITKKSNQDIEENLRDFPIYVLRNYVEMIHKNGWVAYKLLGNIDKLALNEEIQKSNQGSQFLRMLQIESAIVIDEFYEMIVHEEHIAWRDIFKTDKDFIEDTEKIAHFFKEKSDILESTKYQIIKETFLQNSNDWIIPNSPFVNYLWIKQLLFVDCVDKGSYFPKGVGYQRKIDVIVKKMKRFFKENDINIFFIVTDGQQKPYVLKDEKNLLRNFINEFDADKELKDLFKEQNRLKKEKDEGRQSDLVKVTNKIAVKLSQTKNNKYQTLIDFLNGIDSNTCIAPETTAEFYRHYTELAMSDKSYANSFDKTIENIGLNLFSSSSSDYSFAQWQNAYNNQTANLSFMPNDEKWLYLIRITKPNEHSNRTNRFDALGILGFSCTKNLYNISDTLFPKQLLMLLRRDLGKFIEKHHKNDEFAGLRQQMERNKYVFRLNHGVSTYKDAIEDILCDCNNDNLKENLETFYEYLITKLEIIDKLSSTTEIESLSLATIKDEFSNRYKKILTLNVNGIEGFKKKEIDTLVKVNFVGFDHIDSKYDLPKHNLKDIVFELLNNIRKNVCNESISTVTKASPLNIDISIIDINSEKFLSVTNNKVADFDKPYKDDIPHGLDLLEELWRSHRLGRINRLSDKEHQTFTIQIQLKLSSMQNEQSCNNN